MMPSNEKNSRLILGIGNPLISDDTAGLSVVRQLQACPYPEVVFQEHYSNSLDLITLISDYQTVIIIDSIQTGLREPGDWICFPLSTQFTDMPASPVNQHSLSLVDTLCIGQKLGYAMPDQCFFIGIEGSEFSQFSETPLPPVARGVAEVVRALKKWLSHELNVNYFESCFDQHIFQALSPITT